VPRAWQPLRVVAFSHATANAARRGAFDVVHSFSRTRHQDLYRAGGGSHRDYLRRSHSPAGALLREFSPRHRVLLSIEARVFSDPTQHIQCASRLVADALVDDYAVSPERILLLPNAVDSERYGSPTAREAGRRLRAELDEKAERIWLFPASGWHRKGLPILLEALARIRDPGLRLWIAGRDDPRPWQRMAAGLGIEDRIRFLGPRDDLEAVYGAVDGMVLPTRYDAFANVTLEAAASGLAIITTRSNGAAEWLEGGVTLLESANDPDALAQAFAPLADPERRRDLGERARKMARRLDWPQHVSQLRNEYRRIVQSRLDRRVQ
jgi:UDP-glucose:(heptosyl)LPS alpha-1,3-glucosyltransferase